MYQKIEKELTCDVLVIGTGLGGVCAAIQAARLGSSVILLERFRTLGGNSGPEVGVHPSGAHRFHPYAAETGIIEEIAEEAAHMCAKTNSFDYHYNISQLWDSVLSNKLREAGVKVLRCHYAKEPVMEKDRIAGVIAEDIAAYETRRIKVNGTVIDASGDGNISFLAGADFTMGREAKNEYQERSAPEQADSVTLGSSLVGYVVKQDKPVTFVPPKGTPEYVEGYDHCRFDFPDDATAGFIYPTETGGEADVIADDHEIYQTLLGQMYSAWDYIKNSGRFHAENWELVWVSPRVAKRESRRFIGDYVLTQTDVEDGKIFDDAVAFGGFPIDLHDPREDNPQYIKITYYSIPPLYSIPYRCLYSRNIENLLFASRLMSVTHLAHGTVRLQRTLASVGQAAGAAASLCGKHCCTPRRLYEEHLAELQQILLQHDASIPGVVPERNLMQSAKITASSEKKHGVTEFDEWFKLDKKACIMLWDWRDRIEAIRVYVKNTANHPIRLSGSLRYYKPERKRKHQSMKERFRYEPKANQIEWGADDRTELFRAVTSSGCMVEAGYEGEVCFPIGIDTDPKDIYCDEARYVFELEETPEICVGLSKRAYDFVRRGVLAGDAYETFKDSFLFRLTPAPTYGEAENAAAGYARRWCANPVNQWMPDGALPQSITAQWDEMQSIGTIQIVFDTLRRAFTQMPLDAREQHSAIVVRDYEIEIHTADGWICAVRAQDNYNRFVSHQLDCEADAVRLTLKRTWGQAASPGVYQIRVLPKDDRKKNG